MEWKNAVIWRSHPLVLADVEGRKRVNGICEKYPIIIDSKPSYYASFWFSDAYIAAAISSVTVNYLYMEKLLCTFEDHGEAIIDYRKEAWDIENRRKVTGNFDGRTCERICQYFENKNEK